MFNMIYSAANEEQVGIAPLIDPVTTENMDDSHREIMDHVTTNRHLWLAAKRNGTQKRTNVHKSMMHALYVLQYAKRHISE